MSGDVEYREGSASADQIGAHLRACDADFTPPLNSRVDITQYAGKLRERATTFEAWSGGALVGLVAAYLDANARSCFISNVSVCSGFAGRGVGSALISRCLESARTAGVETVALEVHGDSRAALRLYEKAGFGVVGGKDGMVKMQRKIDEEEKR